MNKISIYLFTLAFLNFWIQILYYKTSGRPNLRSCKELREWKLNRILLVRIISNIFIKLGNNSISSDKASWSLTFSSITVSYFFISSQHRLIINRKISKTNCKPLQVFAKYRRGGSASWRMRVNRGSTRTDKPSVSVSEIWKRPLDSYVKTGWYLSSWPAESPVRTLWSPSRESYTSPAYTGPGPFRR